MPLLSPSKGLMGWLFFYFSPPPPHLFALIFRSISFTNRFLSRLFHFLPGSRIPPDMWNRIFAMLFFVVVPWLRQLVAGLLSICPGLIPNSSVWYLRCTKWYWGRFLSEYTGVLSSHSTKAPYTFFSLSFFLQYSYLVFNFQGSVPRKPIPVNI
jgi:hypothetical protein